MNLTLSKRGDYVMRSAISLARAHEEGVPRKIRQVVSDTEVPKTYASQILADLVRAGLVTSRAGRGGGYRLDRPPAQISVLEVVEAAEGPLRAERCALGDGPCRWDAVCPLHETWTAATVSLRDLLARTTLAELAERDQAIESGQYQVPEDAHRAHPVTVVATDVVQVELGDAALRRALDLVGPRLDSLLQQAAREVDNAPTPSGHRRPPAPSAQSTLAPVGPGNDGAGAAHHRYLLAWEIERGDSRSRFEGEMSVVSLDAERSELLVEGSWRQGPDTPLDSSQLEDEARRTLRRVLRNLAGALEASSREDRPAPSATRPRSKGRAGTSARPSRSG